MVNEQDMEKALDALDRQLIPNYAEIGKKNKIGIKRTMLMQRHKGISTSKQEAVTAGSMQWSRAQSSKNLMYWKILSCRTK
jgi:hypothetical protein